MSNTATLHTMSLDDLQLALGWAAEEGWNPGLDDAEAFYAADPVGFFMARVEDTPVAAISVVNHHPAFAFLGLYICRPDWRGKGIGFQTWTHAMAHAGDRTVGLDGVPDQEANYARSGFVRTGQSLRYVGRWPAQAAPSVRDVTAEDLPVLRDMDSAANGFARPAFVNSWMMPEHSSRGTRVLISDGAITGCATWRECHDGTKIGPILAESTQDALSLIADIAHLRPKGPLIIDVPDTNAPLRNALETAGFTIPFTTARMYRGTPPVSGPLLQSIATMELG